MGIPPKEPQSKLFLPFLLILAGGAGMFYFLFAETGSVSNRRMIKQDSVSQTKVNDHLIGTAAKIALDQEKADLMVRQIQNNTFNSREQSVYENSNSLDLSSDHSSSDVHKIIRPRSDSHGSEIDPNSLIQSKILDDEEIEAMTEEYQIEYAKQYIENARRDGWDIKLDKDFRVIQVRPIKK